MLCLFATVALFPFFSQYIFLFLQVGLYFLIKLGIHHPLGFGSVPEANLKTSLSTYAVVQVCDRRVLQYSINTKSTTLELKAQDIVVHVFFCCV